LRRGSRLLHETREDGAGRISGLGVGLKSDGTPIAFWSRGAKVEYLNPATSDRAEVGSDLLGSISDDENCWFAPYQNLAGAFMYVGSPNSGIFKIPTANPASAVNQQVNNFRFGNLRFGRGRSLAARRNGTVAGNKDDTGAYLSHIDKALLSSFTQTTGEAYGTGDGSTKTFAHTLVAVSGAKTAMYVAVTDSTETFADDRNGNMVGSAGGTGTVNYATGQVSVTFAVAPTNLQAITCSYYTEDATDDGPLDFDTSTSGSGKPKVFRQDDGGANMVPLDFMDVTYWLHTLKTWGLTISLDDLDSVNLPYRAIGIPNDRAACETPDGILLIDTSNPSEPKVRRLEIGQNTNNLTIVPTPISDALDLSIHAFDKALAFRWGDYEIICCQNYTQAVADPHNSVMYVRNVHSGAWDKLGLRASCLALYDGSLLAGDPLSNNVYVLFSGFDDDEGAIENHWEDGQLNLGTDNLKVAHYMRVTGLIQNDQAIDVYLTLDDGTPVHVFTIEGDGSYVDQGISTSIGSYTIGSKSIGGEGEATAHPFDVTFHIHTARFQFISTRFQATGIGHAAINSYEFKDIRDKGRRSLPIKTV
jgi:hypothetical protein